MASTDQSTFSARRTLACEPGRPAFGVIGGLLAFAAASGLAIWLLPFSAFTQVAVLLHTVFGLAAVLVFAKWQYRHWLATRKSPRRPRKVSAYIGFWVLAASIASGVVITWQALAGLYMSRAWDQIHFWTGVLCLPFLAYHLIPGKDSEPLPELKRARRRVWKTAGVITAGLLAFNGILVLFAGGAGARRDRSRAVSAGVFAPSNSTTETGRPLPVGTLANSESCGAPGCHTAIYEEWRASAHRWSAEDQFFQTVRGVMTELHGRAVTGKCSGCHDPVSLLSGQKDPNLGEAAPGYKEGDSCVVCHAVRKVDERGIGSYVLGVPKPYLFEASTAPFARKISHFLVRSFPAQHSRDYSLAPVRRPDSCAPCHKEYDIIVPEQGPVQVETQYDDWKQGKWNTDRDAKKRLYCQQCHMYSLEGQPDPYDLKAGLGRKHRNHRFAAANQFMPSALASPDAAGQIQRVTEWLKGNRTIPEISKIWPEGPVVALKLAAPPPVKPGARVRLQIVLSNNKAGHGFPTGPLNIVRAWLEVIVRDRTGRDVFHSGKLDGANHIEAGSYVLKPLAIDMQGRMIMEPDLWHPEGPKYRPAILAGQSAAYDYEFHVPPETRGPLMVSARLRYRKANQFFMDSVYPGAGRTAPVTDVSTGSAEIVLADRGGI